MGALTLLRNVLRGVADLRGQVVLITGGSRGLGLLMARGFAAEGCKIAVCARDEQELERARDELQKGGIEIYTIRCDVADREQVERMVEEVRDHFGSVDILVNNASVLQVGPLESMTREDFEEAVSINFWGTVNTTLAVLPAMRARKSGRIVNITSIGGRISVPHLLPYNCGKFAVVGFSQGLRAELAQDGIVVTTIVPGLMRTGSPVNAWVKGNIKAEWTLFGIIGSLPGFSVSAEDAARAIVGATRRGEAERIIGAPYALLGRLAGLFPNATGDVLALVTRFLPRPDYMHSDGKEKVKGQEARERVNSPLVDSVMGLNLEAARRLNEFGGSQVEDTKPEKGGE